MIVLHGNSIVIIIRYMQQISQKPCNNASGSSASGRLLMTSLRSWRHPPIPIIRKWYVMCASLCNLGLDTSAVTGAKSCTLAMNPLSVLQSASCSNFLRMRNPDFISHKLPTAFSPARSSVSLNILAFESARVSNTWLPATNATGYLMHTDIPLQMLWYEWYDMYWYVTFHDQINTKI